MIVTRFAPSPTGLLHLGHAYAAHYARERGERFLLRMEDIDVTRSRPEFEAAICEDLGVQPDWSLWTDDDDGWPPSPLTPRQIWDRFWPTPEQLRKRRLQ